MLAAISLRQLWAQVRRQTVDLLFPARCVVCLRWGDWLCEECCAEFAPISSPVCIRCGDGGVTGALCGRCRAAPLAIDGIRSVYYFEGGLRDALHQFKYGGLYVLAEPLGALLADYWLLHPVPADLVVPVPLYRGRQRRRGYNQSALLAHQMVQQARAGATPLTIDTQALRRSRPTTPQVELGAEQRRQNVHDAFQCGDDRVQGKRVLLIDDVCTTGSTLEACAQALCAGGAASVWALTLARAH